MFRWGSAKKYVLMIGTGRRCCFQVGRGTYMTRCSSEEVKAGWAGKDITGKWDSNFLAVPVGFLL